MLEIMELNAQEMAPYRYNAEKEHRHKPNQLLHVTSTKIMYE